MGPIVERIVENVNILGEGPHWDPETGSLYFIDIYQKTIHRYHPSTKNHYSALVEGNNKTVSFIVGVKDKMDHFVISSGNEICEIIWDGVSDKVLKCETLAKIPEDKGIRFNDAKVDPKGRLWAGTMGKENESGDVKKRKGSLYSLLDNNLEEHFNQVDCSNGLAWNYELGKMYYIDSTKRTIDQFDFDVNSGTISNRTEIFHLDEHNIPGLPDGQTIDSDGNLWIAIYSGSRIIKIDPRKPESLLEQIEIPASQVTSVEFGGKDLDELYVTTARTQFRTNNYLDPPIHGALYKITNTGSKGILSEKIKL